MNNVDNFLQILNIDFWTANGQTILSKAFTFFIWAGVVAAVTGIVFAIVMLAWSVFDDNRQGTQGRHIRQLIVCIVAAGLLFLLINVIPK